MDFEIPTGKGTETLTAKFGVKCMRSICSRGSKILGGNPRGPNSIGRYINGMSDPEILVIVVEEVLKAGGNNIGGKDGINAEDLIDSYIEAGNNIGDFIDFLVQEFNKSFSPRDAPRMAEEYNMKREAMAAVEAAQTRAALAKLRAAEAEAIAEEEAAIKRETKAKGKHGKTSSDSESGTSG